MTDEATSVIEDVGDKVLTYKDRMVELLKHGGCFVNTKIGLYRGSKRLTASELGIVGDLPKKLVQMGSIKLLPDDICEEMKLIRSIENRVNGLVNLHTFEFEGFGKYIKNSETEKFAQELNGLRDEFFDVVAAFEENYQDYIERSVEFWGGYSQSFGIPEKTFKQSIRESFVPAYELREKFKFSITFLQMPNPAKDAWEQAETEAAAMSAEFVELTMRQLRQEAFDAMDSMATAIESGKWNKKTLDRIPKLIERIECMQLVPDDELTGKLQSFKENFITMSASDYKKEDNEKALSELQGALGKAVDELKEMAEADMRESIQKKFGAGGNRKLVF